MSVLFRVHILILLWPVRCAHCSLSGLQPQALSKEGPRTPVHILLLMTLSRRFHTEELAFVLPPSLPSPTPVQRWPWRRTTKGRMVGQGPPGPLAIRSPRERHPLVALHSLHGLSPMPISLSVSYVNIPTYKNHSKEATLGKGAQ